MGKSESLKDKQHARIVIEEIIKFEKLMKGHEKILHAIAKL